MFSVPTLLYTVNSMKTKKIFNFYIEYISIFNSDVHMSYRNRLSFNDIFGVISRMRPARCPPPAARSLLCGQRPGAATRWRVTLYMYMKSRTSATLCTYPYISVHIINNAEITNAVPLYYILSPLREVKRISLHRYVRNIF